MHNTTKRFAFAAFIGVAVTALSLSAVACNDDEPAGSDRTEGGENAVDRAHQDFKEEVKPAADWVDEKSNEAASEGKKAVEKTADAIDDTVDDD